MLNPLKLDNEKQIFFYEQDHYYLSNFSAFKLRWMHHDFDTSEQAYQWSKFHGEASHHPEIQRQIQHARSAHEAFKIAEDAHASRRTDWERVKFNIMGNILRAKVEQHIYVRRKLLETGDRELIENSWRDPVWGWGPNRDGQNMLGKIWMEVRSELRATEAAA